VVFGVGFSWGGVTLKIPGFLTSRAVVLSSLRGDPMVLRITLFSCGVFPALQFIPLSHLFMYQSGVYRSFSDFLFFFSSFSFLLLPSFPTAHNDLVKY